LGEDLEIQNLTARNWKSKERLILKQVQDRFYQKKGIKGLVCSPCDCKSLAGWPPAFFILRGHGSKEKEHRKFKTGLAKQF